ncbi:MAG TPA: DNA methyltransferase [Fervidobacterium sp.]|jgi:DNA modification methylase|nr:DNA methyltransferase [Fervidobacterium sp.]HQF51304.1 DNA methyltransferase [Paludibacteraceae bacterium]HOP82042.1 DNA methyltransferase [Fervidobacterium sp.]HPC24835.1 DNA methyltransferase [Fervidobacterium sp.]HPT58715.1 DNA methyltransferase [Fervidobacterium sp.]
MGEERDDKETKECEETLRSMIEVTQEDYKTFVGERSSVVIDGLEIKLGRSWTIKSYGPQNGYALERTTVWNFPDVGRWATHRGNYRGSWSPYIPRNLILKYTEKGEWILDQMMGSGTTLVEAKLLERNAIGLDINQNAVMVARDRLNFYYSPLFPDYVEPTIRTFCGDARNLDKITDESIDLIATHPPYAKLISYTRSGNVEDDISQLPFEQFITAMYEVAQESFRVLKPGKVCAILVSDARKHKHYVPVSTRVLQVFLDVGFILKEDIVKIQRNLKWTSEKWRGEGYDFYVIGHEHIFIFEKPKDKNEAKKYKFSAKWW